MKSNSTSLRIRVCFQAVPTYTLMTQLWKQHTLVDPTDGWVCSLYSQSDCTHLSKFRTSVLNSQPANCHWAPPTMTHDRWCRNRPVNMRSPAPHLPCKELHRPGLRRTSVCAWITDCTHLFAFSFEWLPPPLWSKCRGKKEPVICMDYLKAKQNGFK